jgi:dipeptidyl aminopeptidase/acylaminoacyl peptidase
VIDVHGGPTAQAKREFSAIYQYLVSKGYVVLVPNVRGSTGYGRTYTMLDNLDLGGGPLKDVIACKKWLGEHANVADDRVAIMGASYGGYMALAAAAFTPTEFAAHVDYFGFSDLKRFVESYPPYWAVYSPFTHKKYGDPKNPAHAEYQYERSPLNFVERNQRPLLVVQGENDAVVPKEQSDRLVEALHGRDVPVYYLVIPGEGHGFSKTANRLKAYETTDRFLDRYIFHDKTVHVLP